jgi:hypothetical protein
MMGDIEMVTAISDKGTLFVRSHSPYHKGSYSLNRCCWASFVLACFVGAKTNESNLVRRKTALLIRRTTKTKA